jgi:Tfp pilus assembly protein PilW
MTRIKHFRKQPDSVRTDGQSGLGLAEFLVSILILLVIAASVFGLLSEIQRKTGYQAEVQSVLNNTQLAMQMVGRYIRQAGNDPLDSGFTGITIMDPSRIGIASDLTGSESPGNPDKGDPDGDTLDSGEDVIIRCNSATRSLEIVPRGSSAQVVAGYISGLSFQYYDSNGGAAAAASDVRIIKVTISGTSLLPDPDTHTSFGVQLSSDFHVAT